MSGDLAFNSFSRGLSKEGALASKTILRIFYKFSSIYLAARGLGGPTVGELTGVLSWLDFGVDENPDRLLEVRSLREHPRPRIEVILVVGVERSGAE